MPDFAEVADPQAGAAANGRIRYDLRKHADATAPVLVLIGGMTQTLASWGGQLRPLSETRTVLAYETRGQGATELALHDASLPRHVEDAAALLQALQLEAPVDLCGFSFGGRVALAIAGTRPDLVRRLVVAGVGRDRTVLSRCIIDGWRAALLTGDLEALARISLSDIVGADFLEANAALVEPMIKAVVTRNNYAGISALFRDTMGPDADVEYAPDALAAKIRCPAFIVGGGSDRVAPPHEVRALAAAMGASHRIFEGAGHTVPIEAAEPWRRAVLSFLDAAEPNAEATLSHGTVRRDGEPSERA